MSSEYIPERGDLIWVNFDPTKGHEQKGHRPAVVLSRKEYNDVSCMCLVVPVSTHGKGSNFNVELSGDFALSNHLTNIDWRARGVEKKGEITADQLAEIVAKITALIN